MTALVERAGLQIAGTLAAFVEERALAGTGITADAFWAGLAAIISDLGPENRALLARRDQLQSQIDDWHIAKAGQPHDAADYRRFLEEIGYIVAEPSAFSVETNGLDPEVAVLTGPQLVVPITNARFALNAANARWGSLYDALYGTDALGDRPQQSAHDPARAARVVAWVRRHLDQVVPLAGASWGTISGIKVIDGQLHCDTPTGAVALADPGHLVGWLQDDLARLQILLRVNGLLIEIFVDPATPLGAVDAAGISDVRVEAALSTIMDFEDSVAVVDAEDKVQAYGNWLGLMRGDLTEAVTKDGKTILRRLNPDAVYTAPQGGQITVRCRSLLLCRNVGHLMTTPAVLDRDGAEIGEGFLDAMVTALCALHDRLRIDGLHNAAFGAIYIVKPKMHGPEEVAFACTLFGRVETALGLPPQTIKLGLMDEERRTSVNLRACIHAARDRIFFVNTGFLDRTGDEIHTVMEAGPVVPKDAMRRQAWIRAYEDRNVDIALAVGLVGRGQIGKGMWTRPDDMAAMLADKIAHPRAGASCAWVPSPVAATLHATHYHLIDVAARQAAIVTGGARGKLDDLLTLPIIQGNGPSAEAIRAEVENDAQGILGYVVRWVDQGIGCSKVPDLHDISLMEDRATCRISAQGLANWLHHGLVTEADVMAALHKMALVVDRQNVGDPAYAPMAPGFDGLAFQAACDLVFRGRIQPSGYTEPVLHRRRMEQKVRVQSQIVSQQELFMPIPVITESRMITSTRLTTRVLFAGPEDGVPVLFVHGNLSSATWWEEAMLRLPPGLRAVAPDLRGYGDADRGALVDATRGMRDFSDDLVALMDAMGTPAAHMVGHSLGGGVLWQLLADHPGRVISVAQVCPSSPFGFGATRMDGTPAFADGAGSGGAAVNPEFAHLLAEGARGDETPFHPRAILNTYVWKPPFVPARIEDILTAALAQHCGDQAYPGDAVPSPNWPGAAAGRFGPINAMAPIHQADPLAFTRIAVKPPVLWIRGADDPVVADASLFDLGTLGSLGAVPGWPGADVMPPQPMISQTAMALEVYRAGGGRVTEVVLQECGHSPYLERPSAFDAALHAHLAGGDPEVAS